MLARCHLDDGARGWEHSGSPGPCEGQVEMLRDPNVPTEKAPLPPHTQSHLIPQRLDPELEPRGQRAAPSSPARPAAQCFGLQTVGDAVGT